MFNSQMMMIHSWEIFRGAICCLYFFLRQFWCLNFKGDENEIHIIIITLRWGDQEHCFVILMARKEKFFFVKAFVNYFFFLCFFDFFFSYLVFWTALFWTPIFLLFWRAEWRYSEKQSSVFHSHAQAFNAN